MTRCDPTREARRERVNGQNSCAAPARAVCPAARAPCRDLLVRRYKARARARERGIVTPAAARAPLAARCGLPAERSLPLARMPGALSALPHACLGPSLGPGREGRANCRPAGGGSHAHLGVLEKNVSKSQAGPRAPSRAARAIPLRVPLMPPADSLCLRTTHALRRKERTRLRGGAARRPSPRRLARARRRAASAARRPLKRTQTHQF